MQIRKILFATNGSSHSESAMHLLLGGPWNAETEFCVLTVGESKKGVQHLEPGLADQLALQVGQRLAAQFGETRVERRARSGSPVEVILKMGETVAADLLVVGAHTKPLTLEDNLKGTVLDLIVQNCPISTLIVRNSRDIRRVLVCVDIDQKARHTIELISELDWPDDVEFRLLNVFNPPTPEGKYAPSERLERKMFKQAESGARAASAALLASCAGEVKQSLPSNRVDTLSLESFFTGEEILESCRRYQPDLLVLGPRSHGGLDKILLGSVTKEVLKQAGCSVLVVRTPNADGVS